MQQPNQKHGDLGSLILFTIAFVGAGCVFALICVFDFLASGWNVWSVKRLEPFAALVAVSLALLWRYRLYHRCRQQIKAAETPYDRMDDDRYGVWPPPPRPRG
jgi:hypothetical protein